MLGLKRGTVKLVAHKKQWATLFEQEKKRLWKAVGSLADDIQHIGSTSIPGIPAKPILDISLGLRFMKDIRKLHLRLTKLGYQKAHIFPGSHIQIVYVKGPEVKRTHYLHVMKFNGLIWKNDLLFRDYLRSHRQRALQYAKLKRVLAKKYANKRVDYTEHKADFIHKTLRLAKKTVKTKS